ncbi:MAG TPA: NRDE family protein [Actinomycetes bacterium]|nr:NRDE family protein [Actinomycetes bacterium]
MCTVILAWQVIPDAPLVLAANRDELLARPSDPPMLLSETPPRWGGRDRLAGGTWLAVDPAGRVGAVTNRHPGGRPPERDASRQSRGLLPLEALAADDEAALAWMVSLDPRSYNPVNVIYASDTMAAVTSMDDDSGRRTVPLAPGVHVLTEQDVDDDRDAKTQGIRRRAEAALAASTTQDAAVESLRAILRSHEADHDGSPPCVHGELHGTVSSSTVVVTGDGVRYDHAEGPPCVTEFDRIL